MKKPILVISLLLIFLISGCFYQFVEQGAKQNFALDSLIVSFNGEEREGLIANANNEPFKNKFIEDLNILSQDNDDIPEIALDHIFSGGLEILIRIDYTNENLTVDGKEIILREIKSKLENKWYIREVNYNLIVRGSE